MVVSLPLSSPIIHHISERFFIIIEADADNDTSTSKFLWLIFVIGREAIHLNNEEMTNGNISKKILGKLGITGIASAILTIAFGIIILTGYLDLELLVGLYLIIVGGTNLAGYLSTVLVKPGNYVEQETIKMK